VHWKANQKAFCIAKANRAPPLAAPSVKEKASLRAAEGDDCIIFLDPLSLATTATFPCWQVLHSACAEGLMSLGLKQACLTCRSALPPGPEQLFDGRLCVPFEQRLVRKDLTWGALTVEEQNQMNELVEKLTQAANHELNLALPNPGTTYKYSQGAPESHKEAAYWFRKAADQENSRAQFYLGVMYDTGQGVTMNDKKAAKRYQKAADQGNVDARCIFGYNYDNGRGATQGNKEAARSYRKAADQGDASAQFTVGIIYMTTD
jgi:hypothetical protein